MVKVIITPTYQCEECGRLFLFKEAAEYCERIDKNARMVI